MKTTSDLSPSTSRMMDEYRNAKERHPGMILLFRMGDFYEAFGDDAEILSRELCLTLSRRDKTIPMAGFPKHSLEFHLRKLLASGRRVAVCDQSDEIQQPVPQRSLFD